MFENFLSQNVTIYQRRRILLLNNTGRHTLRGIAEYLCANDGLKVSKSAVHRILLPRQALKCRNVVTERQYELINSSMKLVIQEQTCMKYTHFCNYRYIELSHSGVQNYTV